jgi:predicted secreted protein
MIRRTIAALLLLAATPAAAQTKLELDATGTAQATPDQLEATLAAQQTGRDPSAIQRHVNEAAEAALHEARAPAIQQRLLGYDMIQDDKRQWTATARLSLLSADGPELLDLIGRLQSHGLALESLAWQLSPKLHATEQAEATRTALKSLQDRAAQAAAALGLHIDHIAEIRLSDAGQFTPRPFGLARAMSVAPSAPAAPLSVEVTASATVLLRP